MTVCKVRFQIKPLSRVEGHFLSQVGLFSGAFIVLIIAVVLSAVFEDNDPLHAPASKNDYRIAVRLYRGPFLVIVFVFLMGVNVYGWR